MKKIKIFGLLNIMAFTLCGCIKIESPYSPIYGNNIVEIDDESNSKVQLILSHSMPIDHSTHKAAIYFSEIVKERTNNDVYIAVSPLGTLGSEPENLNDLMNNELDIGIIGFEYLAKVIPEAGVFVMPYMFEDEAHLKRVLDSSVGDDIMNKLYSETDLHILSFYHQPFKQIFTKDRPIYTAEDMIGLSISIPQSSIYAETFQQLGVNPVPIDWDESVTRIHEGFIDSVECTAETSITSGLESSVQYMNVVDYAINPMAFIISDDAFRKIPSEYVSVLSQAAEEASEYVCEISRSNDAEYINQLTRKTDLVYTDKDSIKEKINYNDYEISNNEDAIKVKNAIDSLR